MNSSRIMVRMNEVIYILIRPFCSAGIIRVGIICDLANPFGPVYSCQVWSIYVMFWLNFRLAIGMERCSTWVLNNVGVLGMG